MILSRDGFKIKKKDIDLKIIKKIREDLTVKPFVYNDYNNTSNEKRFTLYLESPKKLYLPRFYGIDLLGDNYINKIDEGVNIDGDVKYATPVTISVLHKKLPIFS